MKKIYRLEIYGYFINDSQDDGEMLPISDFYDNIEDAQSALRQFKLLSPIDKINYLENWNVFSRNEEAEIMDYKLITKN